MWGSAASSDMPGRSNSAGRDECLDGPRQPLRLFNVRHVAAVRNHHELSVEPVGVELRRAERDGIFASMDDEHSRTGHHSVELTGSGQVVVAEALPDRLLNATRDAERREVASA